MSARRSVVLGLLMGGLLLGLSCSGPSSSSRAPSEEGPARVYHVQFGTMEDKAAAQRRRTEALAWWSDRDSSSLPTPLPLAGSSSDLPVAVVWKAPLYRVRLGPFASRSAAESVLGAAREAFPDAFIAPERRRASNTP